MLAEAPGAGEPGVPVAPGRSGDEFVDDYEWLRDKADPEVTAYLEAENAYTEAVLAPAKPLEDALFAEIRARKDTF